MKPTVEQLETRHTPSVVLTGGLLSIVGTEKADVITTTPGPNPGDVVLVLNNAQQVFSGVAAISVDAGNGNDVVTNFVPVPTTIKGPARMWWQPALPVP